MNVYYITGTSRGIGKSFAEYLLKQSDTNFVIGISRQCAIQHKNYTHFTIDLSDIEKVKSFTFESYPQAKKIILINNAGALGNVAYNGNLDADGIIRTYQINLIAPVLLTNAFIAAYKNLTCERIIVNISSGAAQRPIDGWSIYCSTKAGLEMHTKVADAEQKIVSQNGIRVLAIAPGVVDTQMQVDIRSTPQKEFSRLNDFIQYKNTNQLASPDNVSEKLFSILNNVSRIEKNVFSVKDY